MEGVTGGSPFSSHGSLCFSFTFPLASDAMTALASPVRTSPTVWALAQKQLANTSCWNVPGKSVSHLGVQDVRDLPTSIPRLLPSCVLGVTQGAHLQ